MCLRWERAGEKMDGETLPMGEQWWVLAAPCIKREIEEKTCFEEV